MNRNSSREDFDPYFYDPDAEREAIAAKRERMEAYWEMRAEMQAEDDFMNGVVTECEL
jgi:hypothetical protein